MSSTTVASSPPRRRPARPRRTQGQSLTEFALLIPLMFLILLFGIDFGRVFLGWVELNNVVREAANFAAQNPTAWNTVNPDTGAQAQYTTLITQDAAGINCVLPSPLPTPSFPNGPNGNNAIGQPVSASITCRFSLITPVISSIVGNPLPVTASAAFPIRNGAILGIPVAAGSPTASPTAAPTATPAPTASATATPTPMCIVPNFNNVKAINAQATWAAAGFASQVLFNPAFPASPPPSGGNIKDQSLEAGASYPCDASTAITVTWQSQQ